MIKLSSLPLFLGLAAALVADPLTKQFEIDFTRDAASRDLKGLTARSDSRLLFGPTFTDLDGPALGEILWTLEAAGHGKFLVGTGPDGKVMEISPSADASSYQVRELADVDESQVTAIRPLDDGAFLFGTSPTAAVYLVRKDKIVSRVPLPADSVFDFLQLQDGSVLVATGNPAKIYRLDLKKLAAAGLNEGKASEIKNLEEKGFAPFAEVRDRNVRRLARLPDGRILAGSSPRGNVYSFAPTGGAPLLLQENRDAEVVDFLPAENGEFYAAIVFSSGDSARVSKRTDSKNNGEDERPAPSFSGRSSLVRFSPHGFPETIVSRSNLAFYRLAKYRGWILASAGEQGDVFGYDPIARRSLIFPGSDSAQVNDLAPLGEGRFLALRNNAPGLALLSFAPAARSEVTTKRLDLGVPSEIGAIRFARVRGVDPAKIKIEARTNLGTDEVEGWSPWTPLQFVDDGYHAPDLRGRSLKLRISLPPEADLQIDKPTVFYLPQNRRPQLNDFRIFPANLGLVRAPEPVPSLNATLGSILFPANNKDDGGEKRKNSFMNSQVVPQTGAQVIYWSVADPDDDNLAFTLSLRPETSEQWTDLGVDLHDTYLQFESGAFPEGVYFTRLIATEQAPRPSAQRLSYTFETDYLTIDRTPPEILRVAAARQAGAVVVTVEGRDRLSLLDGAEFVFNNGVREQTEHPQDGLLDSKHETFAVDISESRAAGATSIEVLLYDHNGNVASRRIPLK